MNNKSKTEEPVNSYNQLNLPFENYSKKRKLSPILKWPGGKSHELKYIIPHLPSKFDKYYEPFVGGGAVFMAIQPQKALVNDKSEELISLYKLIQSSEQQQFFKALYEIDNNWENIEKFINKNKRFFINLYLNYSNNKVEVNELQKILYKFISKNCKKFRNMFDDIFDYNKNIFIKEIKKNLLRKIKRMKKIEKKKGKLPEDDITDNIEASLKSAFYMYFRYLYNSNGKYNIDQSIQTAIFFFIRNFAYGGMFRYNSKGEFNVPYGGIAYNRKNFNKKIKYLKSKSLQKHIKNTVIECKDFEAFFEKYPPSKEDFIFLDPPYDTEFNSYGQNEFTKYDQKRLADYLINKTKAKWMMIIQNTEFILNLYNNNGLEIDVFDKTYLVSFKNRNNKNAKHLLIRNY